MQRLLERQIPALTRAVAQAEIPAAQRRQPQPARSRTGSSSARASSARSSASSPTTRRRTAKASS
jgi:hypothetical protein